MPVKLKYTVLRSDGDSSQIEAEFKSREDAQKMIVCLSGAQVQEFIFSFGSPMKRKWYSCSHFNIEEIDEKTDHNSV